MAKILGWILHLQTTLSSLWLLLSQYEKLMSWLMARLTTIFTKNLLKVFTQFFSAVIRSFF